MERKKTMIVVTTLYLQLIEFVSMDLIPDLTQSMKTLANHKHTVAQMTGHRNKQQNALAQFIFDKEFL